MELLFLLVQLLTLPGLIFLGLISWFDYKRSKEDYMKLKNAIVQQKAH